MGLVEIDIILAVVVVILPGNGGFARDGAVAFVADDIEMLMGIAGKIALGVDLFVFGAVAVVRRRGRGIIVGGAGGRSRA
jgi:hypothetical protein